MSRARALELARLRGGSPDEVIRTEDEVIFGHIQALADLVSEGEVVTITKGHHGGNYFRIEEKLATFEIHVEVDDGFKIEEATTLVESRSKEWAEMEAVRKVLNPNVDRNDPKTKITTTVIAVWS